MAGEPAFADTNLVVYSRDPLDAAKQARAETWMRQLSETRLGRLSFQVLLEYVATMQRKQVGGRSAADVRSDVVDLLAWRPQVVDGPVLRRAWDLQDRFSLSWWDALIVAAAQAQGCAHLITEDLQAGQRFDGVLVVNPFVTEPAAILGV